MTTPPVAALGGTLSRAFTSPTRPAATTVACAGPRRCALLARCACPLSSSTRGTRRQPCSRIVRTTSSMLVNGQGGELVRHLSCATLEPELHRVQRRASGVLTRHGPRRRSPRRAHGGAACPRRSARATPSRSTPPDPPAPHWGAERMRALASCEPDATGQAAANASRGRPLRSAGRLNTPSGDHDAAACSETQAPVLQRK